MNSIQLKGERVSLCDQLLIHTHNKHPNLWSFIFNFTFSLQQSTFDGEFFYNLLKETEHFYFIAVSTEAVSVHG